MREARKEDKILCSYFMVATGLYAEKGRKLRDTEEKKTLNSDDGDGN
jgi:hypothetical protein